MKSVFVTEPDPAPVVELPAWAIVTPKRRAHIARVTALLDRWAREMRLPTAEAAAWRDAGRWHDALRDADEQMLRAILPDAGALPFAVLHGPAAAIRLAADGEAREDVLEAVRWHTLGSSAWARAGRALFMADFLEPGRKFMATERAFVTAQVPRDFDGAFRQVVRLRLDLTLREGGTIFPETAALWNSIQVR